MKCEFKLGLWNMNGLTPKKLVKGDKETVNELLTATAEMAKMK